MILSTNKSEREFSSLATKQEVSFCSDHLSDFLQKAITCSKSNHLRFITTSPRFKCVIAKLVRLLYFLPEGAILSLWALSSSQFEKCSRITEVAWNNFGFTLLIKGEILVRKPLKPIEKTRTKQWSCKDILSCFLPPGFSYRHNKRLLHWLSSFTGPTMI